MADDSKMTTTQQPKFRVLSGTFYWEMEHSLHDFNVNEYGTYEEAAVTSLRQALESFQPQPVDDVTDVVTIRSNERDSIVRGEIEKDIRQVESGECTKTYYKYFGNHKEYHIKITQL